MRLFFLWNKQKSLNFNKDIFLDFIKQIILHHLVAGKVLAKYFLVDLFLGILGSDSGIFELFKNFELIRYRRNDQPPRPEDIILFIFTESRSLGTNRSFSWLRLTAGFTFFLDCFAMAKDRFYFKTFIKNNRKYTLTLKYLIIRLKLNSRTVTRTVSSRPLAALFRPFWEWVIHSPKSFAHFCNSLSFKSTFFSEDFLNTSLPFILKNSL